MTAPERGENSTLGYNAERAACERWPLERAPDDHGDAWWFDARVVETIPDEDGFGTVEPGTLVDVKSAAWRIDNGSPRRGRWLLRERAHRRLREEGGEYALLVASPDDREIVGCVLRPAWWVEELVTTWSASKAGRSGRRVAQIPWSRAFRERERDGEKTIVNTAIASSGGVVVSPDRTVGDDPDHRVAVERYSDLAAKKRGLTSRQVDTIVTAFDDGTEAAIVIERWAADKDLPAAEGCEAVYLGRVTLETEKAWRFAAGEKVAFLPKSLTTLFENGLAGRDVESPQRGLSGFGGETA